MPPRSTNAPNSAMFLTVPLTDLADLELRQQLGLFLGPFGLDQRPAADDDIAARLVDLQHHALDRAIDVIADIRRTANVHLAGGQKHVDADVDQQTTLDLARDLAGDDISFVDGLHDLQPRFDLFGLPLRQQNHPAIDAGHVAVFDLLDQHLDRLTRLWRGFVLFPLRQRDGSLALVSDVQQDQVPFDADHTPDHDLIQRDVTATAGQIVGRGALHRGGKFLLPPPLHLAEIEVTNQITVDHVRSVTISGPTGFENSPDAESAGSLAVDPRGV